MLTARGWSHSLGAWSLTGHVGEGQGLASSPGRAALAESIHDL